MGFAAAMIYKISDNIYSPLGTTTEENFDAVMSGRSALGTYSGRWDIPVPFCASLFDDDEAGAKGNLTPAPSPRERGGDDGEDGMMGADGLTRFEAMALLSARQALAGTGLDVSGEDVVFILSTTKGNVELLGSGGRRDEDLSPAVSAQKIASRLGIVTPPIVACNACISGVSAIILASRLLLMGAYRYAIVCGADCQCRFTVSGFLSLKALSDRPCRPFDMERLGLNLGEAAATIVLGAGGLAEGGGRDVWTIGRGVIRNDAYHISSPSMRGDGAMLALRAVTGGMSAGDVAFVNAHGTATMFNDQMEAVAIERAGLSAVPVNAYKGYYGHTMGAAGILETVLSMYAFDHHTILGTKGYAERGVSCDLDLSPLHRPARGQGFIKMISGFGGCNAAISLAKGYEERGLERKRKRERACELQVLHRVVITPQGLSGDANAGGLAEGGGLAESAENAEREGSGVCDGIADSPTERERDIITWLYKRYVGDYPRFYKMDRLSRLGFVASELLKKDSRRLGIILFNRSSSIVSDRAFLQTITPGDGFFPSPGAFVYTLPNIVTGEIALRNGIHGETSFYILNERDDRLMDTIIRSASLDAEMDGVITGWLDYIDDEHFTADFRLIGFVRGEGGGVCDGIADSLTKTKTETLTKRDIRPYEDEAVLRTYETRLQRYEDEDENGNEDENIN